MKDIVFLFSGQGSQFFKMAEKLYVTEPEFRKHMDAFERIFLEKTGESLISYLYDKTRSVTMQMDDIIYSNPAIYMVEVSLAKTLIAYGICPDVVLGESMGEFAASAIAGIMDEKELFKVLIDFSYEIKQFGPRGRMMAILGKSSIFYENNWQKENVEIVADNAEKHFVISGKEDGIERIKECLQESKTANVVLPVLYPFHTWLIDPIEDILRKQMDKLKFGSSKLKFISGESGEVMTHFDQDYYWRVIRNKMSFREALGRIDISDAFVVDVSPSGTLENLAKMNAGSENSIYSVVSLFRNDDKLFQNVLERFREGRE